MRVAVVGCGGLGLFLASRLAMGGAEVTVVCRSYEAVEAVNRRGIEVYGKGGSGAARVQAAVPGMVRRKGFDYVVAAVRAHQLGEELAGWLAGFGGVVVCTQPGIGVYELLRERLGAERVACLLAYLLAWPLGPGIVEHGGGEMVVVEERAGELGEALRSAGLAARIVGDIEPWRWDRLAVDAGLGAVSAVAGVSVERVAGEENLWGLALNAAREAEMVAKAAGAGPPRRAEEALRSFAAEARGRHPMLRGLEEGRGTEVDYINGAVVRVGVRQGVYTPFNESLYLLLRGLESLYGIEGAGRSWQTRGW